MSSFQPIDLSATGADLLLTDLDVALTFLDLAATSLDSETITRNRNNAAHAYRSVIGFEARLHLSSADREAILEKLVLVRDRLIAAGQSV